MATIKAPFNFVPVSDKVFFPDWANKISQDIPFEDGESGIIELKITAESPIFVRNGHTRTDADAKNDEYKSFNKIDDRYFIPATSIKGAIRNVLEIISFSKMQNVEDDSFGIRDINNMSYRNLMKKQHCGWLQYGNDGYYLTDCGEPGRISLSTIDDKFNTKLEQFVKNGDNFRKDAGRTAKAKYETIGNKLFKGNFEEDTELMDIMLSNNPVDPRYYVKFGGNKQGTLVLTGQPGVRKKVFDKRTKKEKWTGKFYEFVFFDTNVQATKVDDTIIKAFKTVHKNSPDFVDYWGKKLNKGEKIPVFFTFENERLHSIGLSYLYKFPYKKSVYKAVPHNVTDEKLDLSECLFGATKNNAIKGRVQFSSLFSENAEEEKDVILTLGGPKASYYPLYIKQDTPSYKTYDDGTISGWKRYPIRKYTWGAKSDSDYNASLDTVIYPLKKGTVFTGKVRFHNLNKVELGALLSALTFHNTDECFHQIGQGKPYGFGKVKIEITVPDNLNKLDLMALFENAVTQKIGSWNTNNSIIQLFTMAKAEVLNSVSFEYMHMDNDKERNDFLNAKKNKESLNSYSQLQSKSVSPKSLLVDLKKKQVELEEQQRLETRKREEEEAKRKKEEEERQQQENLKKKVEEGLSFLDEKYEFGTNEGTYKVKDFKIAKNKIEQWMKKANASSLPPEQWQILKDSLIRLSQNPDKKEHWDSFDSSIWLAVQKYIGENEAKKWFDEMNVKS